MNIKGTYQGSIPELVGQEALLQERPDDKVVAQFDDLKLEPWCYGWHEFSRKEFRPVEDRAWFGEDKSSWCGNDSSPFRHLYGEDGF